MGVVAPISAILAALVPLAFSWLMEGAPTVVRVVGFVLALASVWLLTTDKSQGGVRLNELVLPVAAGTFFGLFFILIGQVSDRAILWPLMAARAGSLALVGSFLIWKGRAPSPGRANIPAILMAGLLDTDGNVLFALAAAHGRLDVSAVLSSLYPAGTVILAWIILKEKLNRVQLAGVACALVALVLIAG